MSVKSYASKYLDELERRRVMGDYSNNPAIGSGASDLSGLSKEDGTTVGGSGMQNNEPSDIAVVGKDDELWNLMAKPIHGGGGRSYNDTGSLSTGELSRLLSDFQKYNGNVNVIQAKNTDIADKFGKQADNRLDGLKKTNNPTVTYKEEALTPDAPGRYNTDDDADTLYALMNEGVRNVIDDTLGRYAANTGGRASSAAVSAAAQAGDNQSAQATDELMALMSGDDGTGTTAGGTDKNTVGTDDELYDAGFVESYLDRVLGSDATDHLGHMKDVVLDLIDENYGSYLIEKLKKDYPMSYEDRFAQILLYLEDNNLITEAKALEMIRQAGMDKYLGE